MNSRSLLNLFLLLIVLVLIGFTLHTLNRQQSSGIAILDIKRDDITQITIPRSQQDIVLYKNHEQWFMSKPFIARAHSFRINKLLDLSQTVIDNHYPIDPDHLHSYGLQQPRASIIFNNQAVHFGKTNPVSNQRYIQTKTFITLIDDQLYPLISSQPSSFVDLKILDPRRSISALHLPEFSLAQQADHQWSITGNTHASADQIQTLLQHWKQAQAFAVHAYMARKQIASVRIELDSGNTVELDITDTSPWLILGQKQLGIEYHFDSGMYNRLFRLDQPELKSE